MCVDPTFNFTRLGVRVPAVVVSPWVDRGTIDSTVYDHASILATARKLFLGDTWRSKYLTKRDQAAEAFDYVLSLKAPRTDYVDPSQPRRNTTAAMRAIKEPTSNLRESSAEAGADSVVDPGGTSSEISPELSTTQNQLSRQYRPGFSADVPDGKDMLDITPEVSGLSSLLAAKDTDLPLSLGLFGDWGSGKSFLHAQNARTDRCITRRCTAIGR